MNCLPRAFFITALIFFIVGGLALAQQSSASGYAVIVVKLPESATLKIGDYTSQQTGPVRTVYVPPPFEPGYTYFYMVEATWTIGGRTQKATRKVQVQPDQTAQVEFLTGEVVPAPKKLESVEHKKIETVPPVAKKVESKAEAKKIDESKKAATTKDEPKKAETVKDEPKKADAKKEVRKQPGDKKAEPQTKDEPTKNDTRILGGGRTFTFTYAGEVKDLTPGQEASVWLPVPNSTLEQDIDIVSKKLPADGTFASEDQYGNKALFFKAKANAAGKIPFEIVYQVTRRVVKSDAKVGITLQPRSTETVRRFLEPDKLVPISGKPLDLIKNRQLPTNDAVATAKILYDVVNGHMKYSKEGKGWGRGDAVWACDSKYGNCTDFHSLFISLARANKLPSKFEMGFSVPAKRGAGVVGGYHCWAWFMPNGKGWVPVDISEANRFPEMKEYYFGSLTEDRVQFSTGRDINLEPRQQGPALNYFIYPYVEVGGQPYTQDKITRVFGYKDIN